MEGASEPGGRSAPQGDIERFRTAQRLARECLVEVAGGLEPGTTEREVAAGLVAAAARRGARGTFHAPLVWFGDRAGRGERRSRATLPGDTALGESDPVILDFAPVFDGCAVDVSLTTSLGADSRIERGQEVLAEVRAAIPVLLAQGASRQEVVREVRRLARGAGCGWVQESYLFGALGHRLQRLPAGPIARLPVAGLSLAAASRLLGGALLSLLTRRPALWPFWDDSHRSSTPPGVGLWSIEPHIEVEGAGVKLEEILVVGPEGSSWLDAPMASVPGAPGSP